mmetsp:Transcript_92498/g.239480  ORF Transcript_92498/g.239480 Transcript_92498/m.239480 type:complete len:246 (+) Transcript_92498:160-897(+)
MLQRRSMPPTARMTCWKCPLHACGGTGSDWLGWRSEPRPHWWVWWQSAAPVCVRDLRRRHRWQTARCSRPSSRRHVPRRGRIVTYRSAAWTAAGMDCSVGRKTTFTRLASATRPARRACTQERPTGPTTSTASSTLMRGPARSLGSAHFLAAPPTTRRRIVLRRGAIGSTPASVWRSARSSAARTLALRLIAFGMVPSAPWILARLPERIAAALSAAAGAGVRPASSASKKASIGPPAWTIATAT